MGRKIKSWFVREGLETEDMTFWIIVGWGYVFAFMLIMLLSAIMA